MDNSDRMIWSLKVIGIFFTSLFNAFVTVLWAIIACFILLNLDTGILLTEDFFKIIHEIIAGWVEWVVIFTIVYFFTKWNEVHRI